MLREREGEERREGKGGEEGTGRPFGPDRPSTLLTPRMRPVASDTKCPTQSGDPWSPVSPTGRPVSPPGALRLEAFALTSLPARIRAEWPFVWVRYALDSLVGMSMFL